MTINDDPSTGRESGTASGLIAAEQRSPGWGESRLVVRAWQALLELETDEARRYLGRLRQRDGDGAGHRHVRAQHVALLEAGLALVSDDIEAAVAHACEVSGQRQTEAMARATSVLLRFAGWRLKNPARFKAAASVLPCAHIGKRPSLPAALALVLEAAAETQRSGREIAKRLAADALRLASTLRAGRSFALAHAAAVMGELLYEQGELDEAEKLLRRHLAQVARCGGPDAVDAAYATLARIAHGRGRSRTAALLVHELVTIGRTRKLPRLTALGYAREVELYCRLGDQACALAALHNLRGVPDAGMPELVRSEIGIMVRDGELRLRMLVAPSYGLAAALRERIALHGRRGDAAQSLTMSMLLVELLVLTGCGGEAERELLICLRIGRRSGMFQSFLQASAIVREQLSAAYSGALSTVADQAELRSYMASMIGRGSLPMATASASSARTAKIVITGREREILMRMSHGNSNKEIARDLGIGPETVKSHAKRIFVKLGVTKRIEAVTCAHDLSLL
jgi:LuxR family maltose regulon positive regulatory protein